MDNKLFNTLTPRETVSELDKFIVGQNNAKKAVSIALRNRWRRQLVDPEIKDEIAPKNILMIGPTGVGKTEIARRLANLSNAPFLKVEASKFTEVGYVGRDVESMIRDITDISIKMITEHEKKSVLIKAKELAEERILDILYPKGKESDIDPNSETREKLDKDRFRQDLGDVVASYELDAKKLGINL